MNVTENEKKYCQSQTGSSLQKDTAEQKRYVGEYDSTKITENNITNTALLESDLLEKILDRQNLNQAYKKVKANKGAGGVDGMGVDELLPYLKIHNREIVNAIRKGKYKPNPVRRVEIPKEKQGKTRMLGIPTVVDRVIQQAIAQILSPIFERQFPDNSYGFRPKRSAHDTIKKNQQNINEGCKYVVDMDLEKYFDTVNQSKLIEVLSRTIKDGRVISLIHKDLQAGVVVKHKYEGTPSGVPQGGPLSPLLSDIMLNELDKELEGRGHRFVRYADDLVVFCKSKRSATRTLENILPFIEGKLFLKVNREKTVVDHVGKVKFLGFSFYQHKGQARVRIHPKSVKKMRQKVKELTGRNNGFSNEYRILKLKQYITGWVNHFKLADISQLLKEIDQWMRRRIRMVYWKQWKRVMTRYKNLKHLGLSHKSAIRFANTRKSYWRISGSPILCTTLGNDYLKSIGFILFLEYYQQVKV
ncbi:MAG TPA: group II intron reverse transcriptase/maturase [Anaerovoracaceae bacterium]|nr:group II intron reverse transcriptase/maturase [Anaerovoracaceae bacterium]